ncbi:hypothetical protein RRG08_024837 [Elysia crispata]|uniref:Uncharacterized protein n=1 Tax=Elysia crispata TaxID=231223 RepID=A0AAE0YJH8_9GAST|nr:hypothetical protein RRG08_024837 [Elysia crispata]
MRTGAGASRCWGSVEENTPWYTVDDQTAEETITTARSFVLRDVRYVQEEPNTREDKTRAGRTSADWSEIDEMAGMRDLRVPYLGITHLFCVSFSAAMERK